MSLRTVLLIGLIVGGILFVWLFFFGKVFDGAQAENTQQIQAQLDKIDNATQTKTGLSMRERSKADGKRVTPLAEADTRQAADELLRHLQTHTPQLSDSALLRKQSHRRNPPRRRSPRGSFPTLVEENVSTGRKQTYQVIGDAIAGTKNPHMFAAIADSLGSCDPKRQKAYIAELCRILARRQDKGSLPLVWQSLRDLWFHKGWEYKIVRQAIVQFPYEDVTAVMAPSLETPGAIDRFVLCDVLESFGTSEAAIELVSLIGTRVDNGPHLGEALQGIGKPAIEPLISLMLKEKGGVRERAAEILAEFDDPAVGGVMIAAMSSEDPWLQRAGRRWIHGMSRKYEKIQKKKQRLPRGIPPARLEADSKQQRDTLLVLLAAMRQDDAEVRRVAVNVLRNWNGPQALGALLEACLDRDEVVRQAACTGIANTPVPMKHQHGRELARDIQASQAGRRAMAAGGLHLLTTEDLTILLIQVLMSEKPCRSEAAAALGRLNTPTSTAALIAILPDASKDVSTAAYQALWRRVKAKDIASLKPAWTSPYAHARCHAVKLMRRIGGKEVVDPMLSLLERETDRNVRYIAGLVLFKVDDPRLVWPLFDWTVEFGHDTRRAKEPEPYSRDYKTFELAPKLCAAVTADPAPFIELLDKEKDNNRRILLAELLSQAKHPSAKEALRRHIAKGDIAVLQHSYEIFTDQELYEYEDVLISAMNGWMSFRFAVCDHDRIAKAARKQLPSGYVVLQIPIYVTQTYTYSFPR
jgi:HEAT repeat protein